ncbi:MAG: hypothetical protein Q7S79_01040 [bacterium]|nr:hypothetical protein [bacterium]
MIVETSRENLAALQEKYKNAVKQAGFCEAEVRSEVLRVLEASPESALVKHGSQILEYAEANELDAPWLFSVLEKAATDIVNTTTPWLLQPEPPPQTGNPEDHYKYAMAVLNTEGGGNIGVYQLQIQKSLAEAEKLATLQEQGANNPQRRMSAAYRWMKENLGVFYGVYTKHYWDHK